MPHPYKLLLKAGFLLLPLVVLAWRNDFRSRRRTALRALAAVLAGWAWLLASALAVTEIDLRLASSPEQLDAVTRGDGARHLGALLLGWVPALAIVGVYWGAARLYLAVRRE